MWKITFFWYEIGSGFEEPGGKPPPRIPRSTCTTLLNMVMPILSDCLWSMGLILALKLACVAGAWKKWAQKRMGERIYRALMVKNNLILCVYRRFIAPSLYNKMT